MDELSKNYWWESKDSDLPKNVSDNLNTLLQNQQKKIEQDKLSYQLYGRVMSYGFNEGAADIGLDPYRVKINVIKMVLDTAQARVAKNKPKCRFLTSEGDFNSESRGKSLEKFIEGETSSQDLHYKAQNAFFDGALLGTGVIKRVRKEKTVVLENRPSSCIFIDEQECVSGNPKTVFEVAYIDRKILMENFPDKAKLIKSLKSGFDQDIPAGILSSSDSDAVRVIECFRVPLGKKAGRHSIIAGNSTILLDEKWLSKNLPYNFFKYRRRAVGFYGEGLAERLMGIQIQLNKTLSVEQKIIDFCKPTVYVQEQEAISGKQMNERIGNIVKYKIKIPEIGQTLKIPPEIAIYKQYLTEMAFQQEGLTQMSVTGEKPAGLDSGKAIREYNDIESERFAIIAQDYERFYVNLWKDLIEDYSDMAKDGEVTVTLLDRKGLNKIKWSEISLEKDKYILQVYPANLLSSTPSGRLADVKTLTDMGALSPDEMFDLLDFPDTERFYRRKSAWRFMVEKIIGDIVEKGIYSPPDMRYSKLDLMIEIVQNDFIYYGTTALPPERIGLLARWIDDATAIIKNNAAKQQAEQIQLQQEMAMEQQEMAMGQQQMQMPATAQPELLQAASGMEQVPDEQIINEQQLV